MLVSMEEVFMVKYIEESQSYQYFDDEGNRIFLKNISCKQAKDIIMQLMMCDDFIADSNIFHVLILEQSAEPRNGITPTKSGRLLKEILITSKIISVLQDAEPKTRRHCMLT